MDNFALVIFRRQKWGSKSFRSWEGLQRLADRSLQLLRRLWVKEMEGARKMDSKNFQKIVGNTERIYLGAGQEA